jgi:hypothetical protein
MLCIHTSIMISYEMSIRCYGNLFDRIVDEMILHVLLCDRYTVGCNSAH